MRKWQGTSSSILKSGNFTDFEKKVYRAVLSIPIGEVRSYGWVARRAGFNTAARAVGNALNKNPHTIVIPCHRVIKSDGSIGGYSRGAALKRRLLMREGVGSSAVLRVNPQAKSKGLTARLGVVIIVNGT